MPVLRPLPEITGTVGASAEAVVLPSTAGAVKTCAAFFIQNTDSTDDLHWAGGGDTATTSSFKLTAGKGMFVPAGFDQNNGLSVIGSAAGVTYVVIPLG